MELGSGGRREVVSPLFLKLGLAFSVFFGGLLVSQLRSRYRSRPLSISSSARTRSDVIPGSGLKEELHILKNEKASPRVINRNSTIKKSSAEEEGFLVPESDDSVSKEFEETSFELELLEYYGLPEQDAALRELENQLKINNAEAELSSLKVAYARVMDELEDARERIEFLTRRLKFDEEQSEDKEDGGVELERLKELENQITELREVNSEVVRENSELMTKLDSNALSIHEIVEAKGLEKAEQLKRLNEKLTEDTEQLQIDRCTDVEKLVYLKWVNACLRYELRNFHPPHGKFMARDLSKSLSPRSAGKVIQLVIQYADSSTDTSIEGSSGRKNRYSSKPKLFSRLKNMVRGKDEAHTRRIDTTRRSRGDSEKNVYFSSEKEFDDSLTPAQEEIHEENGELFIGDIVESDKYKGRVSKERRLIGFDQDDRIDSDENEIPEKIELRRYADALKKSRLNLS